MNLTEPRLRDGKAIRKRTLANLSALPIAPVRMIRRVPKRRHLLRAGSPIRCILARGSYFACRTTSPLGPSR
jgi:hypothetical protein